MLLSLVRLLDLTWRSASASRDHATRRFVDEFVARAIVAGAPLFTTAYPRARERVATTRRAAERFLSAPNEMTRAAYFRAATSSYPFGPGDGCFAVPELGQHGTPGAGCAGGVGTIAYLVPVEDTARLLRALRLALRPWLAEPAREKKNSPGGN